MTTCQYIRLTEFCVLLPPTTAPEVNTLQKLISALIFFRTTVGLYSHSRLPYIDLIIMFWLFYFRLWVHLVELNAISLIQTAWFVFLS